jgi:hypothetical protein
MSHPTLEATVERMKTEIRGDMQKGHVPRTVETFGELHTYVDANCYGGFCDDAFANTLIADFGGRDENEGMPDGMMNYVNDAQNAVDEWLRSTYYEELAGIPARG